MDSLLETITTAPLYEALTVYPLSPLDPVPASNFSSSSPGAVHRLSQRDFSLLRQRPRRRQLLRPGLLLPRLGRRWSRAEPKSPVLVLESAWFKGNSRFKSPMLQLHKEIVDFCEFLSPTAEEEASRNEAVNSVTDIVKHIWPHSKVEVFGSFRTGLYLPTSDIDIVIIGSGVMEPKRGLQALSKMFCRTGIAKKIQVIANARVPIIKFVEIKSDISFDLSFDLENGPLAADFIKDLVSRLPPLRPLCLILKVFLQQRKLNEVYTVGLGSYALLTMIMALFKSLEGVKASLEQNLGVLLVYEFNASCSLSYRRPPGTRERDIGKNSYNFFQIRSAFAMAFSTLTNPKTIRSLGPNRSILGTIIRPDAVLLAHIGGSSSGVTFDSLLPGAGEPLESRFGNWSDILGIWKMDDAEEEDLPRGGTESSSRKRKAYPDQNGQALSDSYRAKTSRLF